MEKISIEAAITGAVDDQLNLLMCVLQGWTIVQRQDGPGEKWQGPHGEGRHGGGLYGWGFNAKANAVYELPQYISSLDSLGRINLVEVALTDSQRDRYARLLYLLHSGNHNDFLRQDFACICASDRMRVIALLLLLKPDAFTDESVKRFGSAVTRRAPSVGVHSSCAVKLSVGTIVRHAQIGRGVVQSYHQCDDMSCEVDFGRTKGVWIVLLGQLEVIGEKGDAQ